MQPHPDDVTAAGDLTLMAAARAGDRLAFGMLYLRHHAAAWRVACVVSGFSPDAELAVIEGFTRVFSALPEKSEEFVAGGVSFRPYLLACVRQSALDRIRASGRAAAASTAPLAGLSPNGDLVLSSLEHHVARGALASLPERSRTALWLTEVEAMTPGEVAALVGGGAADMAGLVDRAAKDLHTASQAALVGHEVRAECRFTVANLSDYDAGRLDPAKGVLVRSHLDVCPTCRMRLGELANGPATLAATVPAAPLLGGEAQHHWLTSLSDVHPAERLLPPWMAAASPSQLPLPARRIMAAAAGVPVLARRAGRRVRPALPVASLVVAWFAVMVSLPALMEPDTAPGPGGMAMPAVQAYMPDYLPGTDTTRPPEASPPAPAATDALAAGTELVAAPPAPQPGPADPQPSVKLAAMSSASAPRATTPKARPSSPKPLTIVPAVAAAPATVAAAVTPLTDAVEPAVTSATPADTAERVEKVQQSVRQWQRDLERRIRERLAPVQKAGRPDVASQRSDAREELDGRTARKPAGRRNTDHAESA